jgi:hypothetical protein
VTAKSLNCWYRARWVRASLEFGGGSGRDCAERSEIYITSVVWQEASEMNGRSETQSHEKLCSKMLQTKNFLCSPNVIQNIFVRDLNILEFPPNFFLKRHDFAPLQLSMHKSLIFLLHPSVVVAECKCKYLFRWWGDLSALADDVDDFFSLAISLHCLMMCCK